MSVEPYFQDDRVTVYHGDCRTVMLYVLAMVAVDVVVADPPYQETSLAWDRWQDGWPAGVAEAVRTNVPLWCFGSLRMFMERAREFDDWTLSQDVVWEKQNGSSFHADRFRRVHENAALFYRGRWDDVHHAPVFTQDAAARRIRRRRRPEHMGDIGEGLFESTDGGRRLMRSVVRVRSAHHDATNPTQKPLGIVTPLLEYSLPPGGLVLDPMMGSGTTLRAALMCGGRAIGIDVRESECETAVNRWLAQRSLL